MEVAGRCAVVIGGGSGVGRGVALGLAGAGARVVVADIELDSAKSVAEEIAARSGVAAFHHVDATDPSSLAELVERSVSEFGDLHVLSNNVGVFSGRSLAELTIEDWSWMLDFNLLAIIRGVDAFVPRFLDQGGETYIVNTASAAALRGGFHARPTPLGHVGAYAATKCAVLGYSEALRGELAGSGVGVSALCPGLVRSNMLRSAARNRPERYGGPIALPGELPENVRAAMMPAEQVGPIVVEGIRAERFHILTHPQARSVAIDRHRRLMDDFDFFEDAVQRLAEARETRGG